jgi:DNA-binding MarR family transcriptional regulator
MAKRAANEYRGFIDLKRHVPTIIAICANRLSRAASRFYRERYGIGIVEWRVLMFIGSVRETSANRICRETDLDKGAVSRSLGVLARKGLVRTTADGADSRRRRLVLTGKGSALHDRILQSARARERHMMAGLPSAKIDAFIETIRRIEARIESLVRSSSRKRGPRAADRQSAKRIPGFPLTRE